MAGDELKVKGGVTISGTVRVSGSKNATLFLMAAALLAQGKSVLVGASNVGDVRNFALLLDHLGATVSFTKSQVVIDTSQITSTKDSAHVPSELASRLRASVILLGPLLARHGQAKVGFSGGCTIGTRPIGQHLKGLKALGASITAQDGYLNATAPRVLRGAEIKLDTPSVTATVTLLLAAVLADGETSIVGAATEPEVEDLANYLLQMGADIKGHGTRCITIKGRNQLHGCHYSVMPDRIECGTLMIAAALVGNKLIVKGTRSEHLSILIDCLREIGADIQLDDADGSITISRAPKPKPTSLPTEPYPGFPTDLQPQIMALLLVAEGTSRITETVFQRRFQHGAGLARMGANISVVGNCATVEGVPKLLGAVVEGNDIRGYASLLVAALVAEGESIVRGVHHLDRGLEQLDMKLASVGADIHRVDDPLGGR
ncbi:Cell wall formation [Madurella fahalii]|uniref:UDP-N-acetylglucosamine 1-carboxyvinyltransferase n=1 Tax=Madurella fahalii TaxID=1157608 RepID=A0ABQ0FWL4_9PEZI